MNRLFLDALSCQNQDRAPVWMMRQAGRYMPQFRALRERYDFLTLCKQPELAAEVTRLPIDLLGVDAAILFSDILVVLGAMGVGLRFERGVGPVIERPVENAAAVARLPRPDIQETLGYVGDAIRLLRRDLQVPLIGFAGAPFTVASYLIEGGSSRSYRKMKEWMFSDPESFHRLLQHLTDITIEYLQMQVAAGAQALQIFDSWANVLAYPQFMEFSLGYMQQIVEALRHTGVPIMLFCRGSSIFAEAMATAQPAGISVDWNADLAALAKRLPQGIALQGNLDPDVLYAPDVVIEREVRRMLERMQGHPGYIFNLGHGLKPDMDLAKVKVLVETVKQFKPVGVSS